MDTESGDNEVLVQELRSQLQEQVHSLADVEQALLACPGDADLLELKSQLEQGIEHFRDSLAEMEQHVHHQQQHAELPQVQNQQHTALPQPEQQNDQQQQQQEAGAAWDQHLPKQEEGYVRPRWLLPEVPCRFRFSDGQWHPGIIHEWLPQQQLPVSVKFAYPTRQHMLNEVHLPLGLVKQQDQPAADGSSSSSSSSSKLLVGSRVLVLPRVGWLWQPGEVTAVQGQQQQQDSAATGGDAISSSSYTVQLVGQQRILTVAGDCIVAAEAAVALSDEQLESGAGMAVAAATAAALGSGTKAASSGAGLTDGSGSDMSVSEDGGGSSEGGSDDEASSEMEERHLGGVADVLDHARAAADAGVQSESVTFAAWEDSGRGIASKLMARMGFKRGAGLGRRGGGIRDPLEITVLPSKKGLGAAPKHKTHKAAGTGSHSSKHHGKVSGRKRKRMKAAAERHAAKAGDRQRQAQMEAATGEQGLFAFINDSLGHGSEAAAKLQAAGVYGPDDGKGAGGKPRQQTGGSAALAAAAAAAGGSSSRAGSQPHHQQQRPKQQQPDRKGLVGSQDDLSTLKAQVSQLTAMLERNKGNKGLAPQIQAKLDQAKRQYEAAAAQHKQLHKSVAAKEATKKWMKF